VFLFDNDDLLVFDCQLEHCDFLPVVFHVDKLRGNRPTYQCGKFFGATSQVLLRLNHCKLIFPTLRLHRNYILNTLPVDSDVYFVDLNLADALNCCAHVALERIGRHSEKDIDQAVIPNLRQQGLLVI